MVSSSLLSCLLVFSLSGILAHSLLSFNLEVKYNKPNRIDGVYCAQANIRGSLFGALTRLANSHSDFNFTFSENKDYGAYLESVNGLSGNKQDHTYWELLVQLANKTIIRSNVGISCYIPQAKEVVILNYTTYTV